MPADPQPRDLVAAFTASRGKPPERFGTCSRCPAFTFAPESLRTGLCQGCRSAAPTQRVGEQTKERRSD